MSDNEADEQKIVPTDDGRSLSVRPHTSLEQAGQIANRIAGQNIFQRYRTQKSQNTLKRHDRDLELFAEYLIDVGISFEHGVNFQHEPLAWQGVTWGIVEGFAQWLLQEGYAINSVNARLSTVRVYAKMATKAGVIDRAEGMLIQSVQGFSRQEGLNVDEQREQTRIDETTYAYKPEDARRRVVVTRRSTKKRRPVEIDAETAAALKTPQNDSPQAYRDALLMCLLLDHGLRASEAARLKVRDVTVSAPDAAATTDAMPAASGEMTFYRPKVKGTDQEWATHTLTRDTAVVAAYYVHTLYPPTLHPDGHLILGTTRLLKDGSGGQLRPTSLNRVRISERVAWLGKQLGIPKLSAHDCRHYCATRMARLGYGVDELMAWFGWTSAQTAMRYVTAVEVQERYKG